jgi:hypothetical protein
MMSETKHCESDNIAPLFDRSNLNLSQILLREPLLDNSPEADNRRRRRMAMIHQEVYVNTTRKISTMVSSAARKIRQHDDSLKLQQERDDSDCDDNQISTQYTECDRINRKRSKFIDEQVSGNSSHLHRILRIPGMKLLPTFHRSRPSSIDTRLSTEGNSCDEIRHEVEEETEYDQVDDFAAPTTLSPPPAPRNRGSLRNNDFSASGRRFFPSPCSVVDIS